MRVFPFILCFVSTNSKFLNTDAVEKYMLQKLKEEKEFHLNGMIAKNGVLNQQGSILQLALTQNGL